MKPSTKLLIVFLLMLLFSLTMWAQTPHLKTSGGLLTVSDTNRLSLKFYNNFEEHQSVWFGQPNKGFHISFNNGNIEILYDKNATPSEAVKQFFDWLKEYIEKDYMLVSKEKFKALLNEPILDVGLSPVIWIDSTGTKHHFRADAFNPPYYRKVK